MIHLNELHVRVEAQNIYEERKSNRNETPKQFYSYAFYLLNASPRFLPPRISHKNTRTASFSAT